MYKAVHRENGEEILTLHPAWRERMDDLRRLTGADLLVCQGCRQTVRLKAGPRKRPHFAHQHLLGCSYGQESPRVLTARALLYEWLSAQFPGKVEGEAALPGLARPADVVFRSSQEGGEGTVFWVVDALMNQETRVLLRSAFDEAGLRPVWVLLAHLLHPDPNQPGWIFLSPCERDCLRQTAYDEIGHENSLLADDFGCSLHYLDIDNARLITFRSLVRVHAPNVFSGRREENDLSAVGVDATGTPFYPGEERELNTSRTARKRQTERVQRWLAPRPKAQQPDLYQPEQPIEREPRAFGVQLVREKVTCIYCGELTEDWWSSWSEDGERLGKCRACLDKGYG